MSLSDFHVLERDSRNPRQHSLLLLIFRPISLNHIQVRTTLHTIPLASRKEGFECRKEKKGKRVNILLVVSQLAISPLVTSPLVARILVGRILVGRILVEHILAGRILVKRLLVKPIPDLQQEREEIEDK